MNRPRSLQTLAIHAGEPKPPLAGAVAMPIFQSATYLQSHEGAPLSKVRYSRLNNTPNHDALHQKLAALEAADAALVTASGMAAVTTALLGLLGQGDHLLAQDTLYGGTHAFLAQDAPRLGITSTRFDPQRPDTWAALLRPNTRAIYVEVLSNPLLQLPDLDAVVAFARDHGLLALIDATFASPINFQPIPFGFDLAVHSATKYLNGHSDIVAGAIVGRAELVARVGRTLDLLGASLDPHACVLLQRGLKTLALRVRQQNHNALALARALEAHPRVTQVHYPGLETHPQHARALRLLPHGHGGVLSFTLAGTPADADAFMGRLTLAAHAPSLGGVETLVTRPATSSHLAVPPQERAALGIADNLIRVAVGVEDPLDLCDDFLQALA
jgi:cystathionine beta-lyase/cystathionine gamma-synthase